MNKVFDDYSNYYDSIYRDKDYQEECNYIEALLEKYDINERATILDLGCGTGGHSMVLAKRGWQVFGIDGSAKMLSIAKEKAASQNLQIDFIESDLRTFEIGRKFDVAIAMFAVFGYMTTNSDVQAFLENIRKSLNKDGIFIFDVWFGPAVFSEKPADRYKIISNNEQRIIRFVKTSLDVINHTVDVTYKILDISDTLIKKETDETHKMRYFFPQEVKQFLEAAGFEMLAVFPFMKMDGSPNEHDWNVTFVAKVLNGSA